MTSSAQSSLNLPRPACLDQRPRFGGVRGPWLRLMATFVIACAAGSQPLAAEVFEINADGKVELLNAKLAPVVRTKPSAPSAKPGRISDRAARFRPMVDHAGQRYEVSPALIDAIARSESGYDPTAVSSAKAIGIMQLMPATARHLGVDPTDPADNIRGGTAYLRYLLNRYDGNLICTIAAYNAGPGAVSKQRCVPRYRETAAYVNRVLDHLANATK